MEEWGVVISFIGSIKLRDVGRDVGQLGEMLDRLLDTKFPSLSYIP